MVQLTSVLATSMKEMGQNLTVAEGLQLFQALVPHFRRQSATEKITAGPGESASRATNCLAIVEGYSCALVNLLIGLSLKLKILNPEHLIKSMKAIQWDRLKTLYAGECIPRRTVEELEFVQGCLDFESHLEPTIISPSWLHEEMAARGFARFLEDVTEALTTEFALTFGKEADALVGAGNYILAAQLIQRGLEACDKLTKHFGDFRVSHEQYSALNRSKEYEWPSIDWDALQARSNALREGLVTALAKCSTELADLPQGSSWPDYFGHAYSVLADECLAAMESGKEVLFRSVFPAFFGVAWQASGKLRQHLITSNTRNIGISAESLVDLMALSGYGALFSELHSNHCVKLVEQCWNNYFLSIHDSDHRRRIVAFLCAISALIQHSGPRQEVRFRWKRMFQGVLFQRGVLPARGSPYESYSQAVLKHPSPLVRASAPALGLVLDAEHVFMAMYLFKRPESSGVEKPYQGEEFESNLQREIERRDGRLQGDE
jgi:hypothetical protein